MTRQSFSFFDDESLIYREDIDRMLLYNKKERNASSL